MRRLISVTQIQAVNLCPDIRISNVRLTTVERTKELLGKYEEVKAAAVLLPLS